MDLSGGPRRVELWRFSADGRPDGRLLSVKPLRMQGVIRGLGFRFWAWSCLFFGTGTLKARVEG